MMTSASRQAEGALMSSASPGHKSASRPALVHLFFPRQSAPTLAAALPRVAAALRQSEELRARGLVTVPVHADTGGKPASLSSRWLSPCTARPTALPTVR